MCIQIVHVAVVMFLYSVYHRNKKEEVLDKVKRGRLDVVLTTHETAKTKMVCILSLCLSICLSLGDIYIYIYLVYICIYIIYDYVLNACTCIISLFLIG